MASEIIRYQGSPEGFIQASKGTFCIDTQSLGVFIKMLGSATSTNGWRALSLRGYYENEGSPEGRIEAPKYALYFDNQEGVLYAKTTSSDDETLTNTGWIFLNKRTPKEGNGAPTIEGNVAESIIGDVYIDNTNVAFFVYNGTEWVKFPLMSVEATDILLRLSELLTNSTSIISQYFNLFLNPNPMDIEIAQYNSDGILKHYTIPNRAKDRITLIGEGSPEGLVFAPQGQIYLDIADCVPYVKVSLQDSSNGWIALKMPNFDSLFTYNEETNTVSINVDTFPVEGSLAFVNSGTVYAELNKIRNGSTEELFSVAEPILPEHATTKNYVDTELTNFIGYDASTRTLVINAPARTEIIESDTIVGSTGVFNTPRFGTAYSTVFIFDEPLLEPSGFETYIYSDIPCEVIFYTDAYSRQEGGQDILAPYEYLVRFTSDMKNIRCFTDEGMSIGIRKIKVCASDYYFNPSINDVKDIYRQFTISQVEKQNEEG